MLANRSFCWLSVAAICVILGEADPVMWGIDKTYAGLVLLGYHAMMGTPDGVLCHTRNSKTENRYWYNGAESGEIAIEAAVLYPFAETRKALYEGAKQAIAAISRCKPYRLAAPIKAKKQFLVFEKDGSQSRLVTKEGVIQDVLHIREF